MNPEHAKLCSSPEWAAYLQDQVLRPLLDLPGVRLGSSMLELGPGPGAATEVLRQRVARLTVVELDPVAAERLAARHAGGNVTVVTGDCSALAFPDASFDAVGSFTMLHHIPSRAMQLATLREAQRVLRPGGVLIGSDSPQSDDRHHFHADDTYNPIEPAYLLVVLQSLGFCPVTITAGQQVMTFIAVKPPDEQPPGEQPPDQR